MERLKLKDSHELECPSKSLYSEPVERLLNCFLLTLPIWLSLNYVEKKKGQQFQSPNVQSW